MSYADDYAEEHDFDEYDDCEPEVRCDCGSSDVTPIEWDYGADSETGYHDAGMGYKCRACGERWEA